MQHFTQYISYLSTDLKERIVSYWEQNREVGATFRSVGRVFDVPHQTVSSLIKKYQETGSVENRIENRHRPRMTTDRLILEFFDCTFRFY